MSETQRSYMESLGVYLPPREVSSRDVVRGCAHRLLLPLERLTGIESRRMAGETEFGYDLAVKAVEDCLAGSAYGPDEIDLIVSCNISHFDGPDEYSFEPGRAVRLRQAFGCHNALAFDVTNACAGMFTGIYLADVLVRAGVIRRGLVVSGEYITHLTETAQKEIKGLSDPRLACLTLGDAGAAVLIDGTADPDCGFHAIELYTMGRHSDLCIAKVTDQPHGGAIMTTEMVPLAEIAVTAFLQHSAYVVFRLGWPAGRIHHVLPHQTSKTTLDTGSREVKRVVTGRGFDFTDMLINNVAKRGNTATTSHFVALKDCFLDGRVKSGEGIVFGILASGVTVGTAVYRLDDLPERTQRRAAAEEASRPAPPPKGGCFEGRDQRPRIRIEACGVLDPDRPAPPDTLAMLTEASETCLSSSSHQREDVDLLLSTGVYRTDFLTEPAIAALLAGRLKINDAPKNPFERKSLAFDVVNGGLGFLEACYLATVLIRSRAVRVVMIAASEVENNAVVVPDSPRGIRETAAAAVLDVSESGDEGFGAFHFRFFPEYAGSLCVYGAAASLRIDDRNVARLYTERVADMDEQFAACAAITAEEFLAAEGLSRDDIQVVLPPQISPDFISRLSGKLGIGRERFVDVSRDGADLFTSSLPYGMAHLNGTARPGPGGLGLAINVAAGLEVGCAVYHF